MPPKEPPTPFFYFFFPTDASKCRDGSALISEAKTKWCSPLSWLSVLFIHRGTGLFMLHTWKKTKKIFKLTKSYTSSKKSGTFFFFFRTLQIWKCRLRGKLYFFAVVNFLKAFVRFCLFSLLFIKKKLCGQGWYFPSVSFIIANELLVFIHMS